MSTGGTRGPGSRLSSGSPRRLAGNVVVESAEAHGDEKRSRGCDKYKINYINDHFWDLREISSQSQYRRAFAIAQQLRMTYVREL